MFRGTTPTIFLDLETELPLDDLAELWVTFKSPMVELTKDLSEVRVNSETKTVVVSLTQEETLKLFNGVCDVQVRFRTTNNLAYASTIEKVNVERILKEGVI